MIHNIQTPIMIAPTGNYVKLQYYHLVPRISKQEFIAKHMFKMRVCLAEELRAIEHMSKKATRLDKLKKKIEIRLRYFPTIRPRLEPKLHAIVSMGHGALRTFKMDTLDKQLADWTLK